MKNITERIQIAESLALYLLGKANEEQRKRIANWLTENKEHRTLLKELQKEENLKLREEFIKSIDEGKNWSKFVKKIRKKSGVYEFLKYTAVLLPIILGIYWLFENHNKQSLEIVKNTQLIAPGEQRAQLKLQSGKVIELSGADILMLSEDSTVRVENKDKTLNYTSSEEGIKEDDIIYHELLVAKGQEYHMILSDGTEVWINSDSYLKYPIKFTETNREVLLSGEAFFKVKKNAKMPFIVRTQEMDIKVLGTEFNVIAYSKEDQWQTTLLSGKVAALLHNDENTSLELLPNQQLTYSEVQEKYIIKEVDASQFAAWRDGFLFFEDEPLENICTKLSRWYNVSFFFQNKEAKKYQFSGKLPRFEDCETVLSLIEKTAGIKFTINKKIITVSTTK